MRSYFHNIWLWLTGFGRFDEIRFKPGWSARSPGWLLLYTLDYGANVVLLAGQVESISRHAQDHRSGWLWDKLLDVIEKFDARHGEDSGPPLWKSELPPMWVRMVVPFLWSAWATWKVLT